MESKKGESHPKMLKKAESQKFPDSNATLLKILLTPSNQNLPTSPG